MLRVATLVLLTVLNGAGAHATFLPVLSYSSSSGFVYGGRVDAVLQGSPCAEISAMLWWTTRGGQYQTVSAALPRGEGIWRLEASHDQVLDADFFGWGNGGDPDSFVEFDREEDVFYLGRTQRLGERLEAGLGVETRHSVAFDMDSSTLWETVPDLHTASAWSSGPRAEVAFLGCPLLGLPGYTSATFLVESGSGFSYADLELEKAVYAPFVEGSVAALRYSFAQRWGVEDSPFPFLPSLGPDEVLRGYADDRFTGPVRAVANLELHRPVLGFEPSSGPLPSALVSLALFADAGQVAEGMGGIRWDRYHGNVGAGLRFMAGLTKVRIDWTFLSPEGMKLQLGFGEAF